MIDVTTESGTVYRLDLRGKWWRRFGSDVHGEIPRERLYRFLSVPARADINFTDLESSEYPVVGERMYLASLSRWCISTPVVEIIPVDSWEAPQSSPSPRCE